jgi:NodT family efflux transporter outer membrane factor (OMF) lipoprotein
VISQAARRRILIVAVAVSVAGCTTAPLELPPSAAPPAFQQPVAGPVAWPATQWFRDFASPELDGLIALATRDNLDLAAAEARVRQADARARAAGAGILPQIDGTANIDRIGGRANGASAHETDWSALLSASYEIDFWGKNRAALDSARLSVVASQADRETVALTAATSVANTYFQVLSLREQLSLAQANLKTANDVLQVIEARFHAGVATPSELASQKAAVANALLTIAPLEQQESDARGALAVLVGRAPENFTVAAERLDALKEPTVVPGVPSELLHRRPDILNAEANLRAAHADLAAARAALFPSLSLTASGGLQNPAVQAAVITLEGTGYTLSLGAALAQTIFDGGRRRAVRDEAEAKQQELIANYRAAILSALLDVESALSALQHLDAQQAAQQENITQSERAFEGANLRLRAGATDYLTVLDAQRTLSAARDQFSQYRLARLQAIVGLIKSLGGGWQDPAAVAESK